MWLAPKWKSSVKLSSQSGFTLTELILGVVILSVLGTVIALIVSQTLTYFGQQSVRHQLTTDSRTLTSTMVPIIQRGIATTLSVCNCGEVACPIPPSVTCVPTPTFTAPNSRIQFNTFDLGFSTYSFYFDGSTVKWYRQTPTDLNPDPPQTFTLATNVRQFSFTQNTTDPSLITFTLELNSKTWGSHSESLLLPNVMVRMEGTPE